MIVSQVLAEMSKSWRLTVDFTHSPERTREPNRQPSNLEIEQILQASSNYPKVAETFAFINLVIPEAVGKGLERIKAMMDRLNS